MFEELHRCCRNLPIAFALCLLSLACFETESDAGGWREVAPLPEARWFAAAGVGSDSRIYAFGGRVDGEGLRSGHGLREYSMVIYDPMSNLWRRGPEVIRHRYRAIGVKVVGEVDGTQRVVPSMREGTGDLPPFEVPNGGSGPRGRIYWFGGTVPLVFDPATGAWGQPTPPLYHQKERRYDGSVPVYRRTVSATAVAPDGKFYLIGGMGDLRGESSYNLLATVDVYDPATNTWSTTAPMQRARQIFCASFSADGKLYVFGGYGHEGSISLEPDESDAAYAERLAEMMQLSTHALDSVEVYDPATDRWEPRAPMLLGVEGAAAALGAEGRIYVTGGTVSYSNPKPEALVQVYDPATNTWSEGPPLLTARQGHALVVTSKGRLYAIGGTSGHSVFHPLRLLGDAEAGSRGGPLASVEILETAPAAQPGEPDGRWIMPQQRESDR